MGNRWQSNVKSWVYRYLVLRDGEHCLICNRKPKKRKLLDIDHIDNNPDNTDPDNLCLLCHSCNCKMRSLTPREHLKLIRSYSDKNVCVRVRESGIGKTTEIKNTIDFKAASPEMFANACYENQYREWVLQQVREHTEYPKIEAINAGAEEVGCSPVTAGRYLSKLLSMSGPLELVNSFYGFMVKLKGGYVDEN